MEASVREILDSYDARAPLENAWTIPAPWYVDERIAELERRTVFSKTWQPIGRTDQLAQPGQYVTAVLAGEPIVVVRGEDGVLRGFFNVCRHHAASVMTEPEGKAPILRCPYHGWTYSLAGELKGTPDFAGVCGFDKGANGLVPVETAVWEKFVFVRLEPGGPSLEQSLGPLVGQFAKLGLERFHFVERRRWTFECNWKVFVDNYLDGGYHVPHLHKGLSSVLDYSGYTIETGENWCLQWSPIDHSNAEGDVAAVRKGDKALYYWIWPNFMINWYEGVMDTNLVRPARRRQGRGHLRLLLHRRRDARSDRAQRGLDRRRQPRPGRGPRHLRLGPARPRLAGLPRRPPLGAARRGRAPLPPAARGAVEGRTRQGVGAREVMARRTRPAPRSEFRTASRDLRRRPEPCRTNRKETS